MEGETKRCCRCQETKPTTEYYRNKNKKDGYEYYCKTCRRKYRQANKDKIRAYDEKYRAENQDKIKAWREKQYPLRRFRKYGLTQSDYERMLEQQRRSCLICGRRPEDAHTRGHYKDKLCIDHCHESGKVRGLLCNPCNTAIGLMKEDIPRLKAAIAYLEEHQSKNDNDISHA